MVGREWQHLEDLVYIDGTDGLDRISRFFSGCRGEYFPVKYDGFATCSWRWIGDDLVFATANSRRSNTWFNSPRRLQEFILSTGNGESWRVQHASEMSEVMRLLQRHTLPTGDTCYADVLYSPHRPPENAQFTPNLVTYSADGDLGKLGLAVHQGQLVAGYEIKDWSFSVACTEDFCLNLDRVEVDRLIAPQKGMMDFRSQLYKYMNRSNKMDMFESVSECGFLDWLESQVTSSKHQRYTQHLINHTGLMDQTLNLVKAVVHQKNRLIHHLDQKNRPLNESMNQQTGGEGYVSGRHRVKLVPRHRWKPRDETTKRKSKPGINT